MARADQPKLDNAAEVFGQAPLPPIVGDDGGAVLGAGPMRWTAMLVWFMRTMALVWIAEGLFHWSVILGAVPRVTEFTVMPVVREATIIFFAVADLVAAVGLWLASPWVGVKSYFGDTVVIGVNATLVGVYLVLSWLASRERA
jgi:hypothetical protein